MQPQRCPRCRSTWTERKLSPRSRQSSGRSQKARYTRSLCQASWSGMFYEPPALLPLAPEWLSWYILVKLESPFSALIRLDCTALQQYGKGRAGIAVEKQSDSVPPWTRPRNRETSLSISRTLFPINRQALAFPHGKWALSRMAVGQKLDGRLTENIIAYRQGMTE